MKKRISLLILSFIFFGMMSHAQEETPSIPDDWTNLSSFSQDAATLLTELESEGMIPSGAAASFSQNRLTYTGVGVDFNNFALDANITNLLYSATIDFAPQGDELEFCGISAHTQREENSRNEEERSFSSVRLAAYLLIGLDNRGNLFVADNSGTAESSVETFPLPEDISFPIQVTALILNNQLYVFANDSLLVQGLEISASSGSFALLFNGKDEESTCTATNLFAYSFPDEIVTTCEISPIDTANKRQAASVDSSVQGQMLAGETIEAMGQMLGSDGYTWWQLSDETWVRSDVVNASGFCRALPDVTAS